MTEVPAPCVREDARDLLVRLYREIGIAAVAAALQVGKTPPARRIAASKLDETQRAIGAAA